MVALRKARCKAVLKRVIAKWARASRAVAQNCPSVGVAKVRARTCSVWRPAGCHSAGSSRVCSCVVGCRWRHSQSKRKPSSTTGRRRRAGLAHAVHTKIRQGQRTPTQVGGWARRLACGRWVALLWRCRPALLRPRAPSYLAHGIGLTNGHGLASASHQLLCPLPLSHRHAPSSRAWRWCRHRRWELHGRVHSRRHASCTCNGCKPGWRCRLRSSRWRCHVS